MKNNLASIEELPAIPPLGGFDLSGEIRHCKDPSLETLIKKPFLLPSISDFHSESSFADVGLAWNEKNLFVGVNVRKPFEETSFSDYALTDSIELFIDTRDVKTTATITRFCHHFLILPQTVDGMQMKELTRFRGEESHPLCDPSLFTFSTEMKKRGYAMMIQLPEEALHGFAPDQIPRIGFSYRINRYHGASQHFTSSSNFFSLHLHPQLWGSFTLAKAKG